MTATTKTAQPAIVIPETREAAIAALVEADVARWGEGEREASTRVYGQRSYGLLLTALANLAAKVSDESDDAHIAARSSREARALRSAANKALTSADKKVISKGG